jgi:hypothetical protein
MQTVADTRLLLANEADLLLTTKEYYETRSTLVRHHVHRHHPQTRRVPTKLGPETL